MGQKVDPRGLRIGINKTWMSRWCNDKNYSKLLKQDIQLRTTLLKALKSAAVSAVEIERSVAKIRVIIYTNRPGVLIGRGGKGIDEIKERIKRKYFFKEKLELVVDIKEVKSLEEDAQLLAQDMAEQIEKRLPFRRVMKGAIEKAMRQRRINGIKVQLSGRLGGAEMSRREWLSAGSIPLHTLRAEIDYGKATAYTTYGTIGIKVWLYKKEKGENANDQLERR